MKLTKFFATAHTIGLEIDGREIEVSVAYDRSAYSHLRRAALEQHGVELPDWSDQRWWDELNRLISTAIAEGTDIGPISKINRIITGRDEPQRH